MTSAIRARSGTPSGYRPGSPSPLQVSADFAGNVGSILKASVDPAFRTGLPFQVAKDVVGKVPMGAAFGKANLFGFMAALRKRALTPFMADTRPQPKSLDPSRTSMPPNPGRPEYGGIVQDAR